MAVSTKGEPTTSPAIQESTEKDVLSENEDPVAIQESSEKDVLSENEEVGAIRFRGEDGTE